MSKRALVVLAEGFEDIEAVAAIDVLTRAGVELAIAGLAYGPVKAAYGTTIIPTKSIDQIDDLYDAIVFPGGRKNAQALAASSRTVALAQRHFSEGRLVAAICAAPSHVLAEAAGILRGRRATGDPAFNELMYACGVNVSDELACRDNNIITGMGPGAALTFALLLAEYLAGKEVADGFAAKWRVQR